MSANQRTLFESWGCGVSHTDQRKIPSKPARKTSKKKSESLRRTDRSEQRDSSGLWGETVQQPCHGNDDDDDDDDLMLVAVYEAERSLQASDVTSCSEQPTLPQGFDPSAGQIWIYPTNYPIREYQLQISEAALFQNTLVCLPTGLGKTFIASVLMYNFYRWFPAGKIVFMAPTKPLVSQQIEACYKVMGIPQQHMAELTGMTAAQQRRDLWRSRRVFFLTPQVMVNDLLRNTCPATRVKCVVIDEAHKATGNHAFCQVVRELRNQTQQFRVLALSATPGGDIRTVQQVISNLLISHIELRSEDSPDVQMHVHQRIVEKIVVPLGESLSRYQIRYLQLLEMFTSRLTQMRLLNHHDLRSLTKYQIILAREQFRRNPPPHVLGGQHGALEGDFALCISLYHGYELLQQMGLRSLFLFIQNIICGHKESSRMRNELQRNPIFMDLYRDMEAMFSTSSRGSTELYVYSHPKLQKLDEVVLQHFKSWAEGSGSGAHTNSSNKVNTRVMIFSSFRESVQEIAEMLWRHQPLVRVMTFMGQASAGKGVRGFTQKEQLEVVRQFREGGFNTLVSTCVGEEGLDIGEVDLIVCYDAQKSPIRLVQRMGRTGRQRHGRIVIILAEGREERTYNQSQSNRRSINKSIMGKRHSFQMFSNSPRMLPAGFTPTMHKMHISCAQFEHRHFGRSSLKGRHSSLNLQANGSDQKCVKEDGFLTAAEEVVWMSTMRLGEDELQPVFRQTTLLTFSAEQPAQEPCESGRVRELSLWEWRHWQNMPLPTHSVGHSERCLHFTSIMEQIDRMRLEEQADCDNESQVILNLQTEELLCCSEDGGTTKPNTDKIMKQMRPKRTMTVENIRTCSSKTSLHQNHEEKSRKSVMFNQGKTSSYRNCDFTVTVYNSQDEFSQEHLENPSGMGSECVKDTYVNDHSKTETADGILKDLCGQVVKSNAVLLCDLQPVHESSDLSSVFYQPQWNIRPHVQSHGLAAQTFQMILANVEDLLSKSPPQGFDFSFPDISTEPNKTHPKRLCFYSTGECDVFSVKFSLNLSSEKSSQLRGNTLSPSGDEMFDGGQEDAEANVETAMPVEQQNPMGLDESVDLFEEDEAFLQVTIPDIQTPDKTTGPYGNTGNPEQTQECMKQNLTDVTALQLNSIQSSEGLTSPRSDQSSEVYSCSQDLFSVNFDLGVSFDSEEEESTEAGPAAKQENINMSALHKPRVSVSPPSSKVLIRCDQSPFISDKWGSAGRSSASTPNHEFLSALNRRAGDLKESCSWTSASRSFQKSLSQEKVHQHLTSSGVLSSDSDEMVVREPAAHKQSKSAVSDLDSPFQARRKRAAALNTSEDEVSDEDFQQDVPREPKVLQPCAKVLHRQGRQFLDEEAELSEDKDVSSDEDDGDEQNCSLAGFVVNTTQCSQGLNESEMQAFYLKSIKSPEVQKRLRMTYKPNHNLNIFSQVPEQDETYAEDSFVVHGSDVEEEASDCEKETVEIIPEDSYIDGRKQYATRRRAHFKLIRAANEHRGVQTKTSRGNKRSRIIRMQDSSEDEETEFKLPHCDENISIVPEKRVGQLDRQQEPHNRRSSDHTELKNLHQEPQRQPTADAVLSVLVDSRCINGGSEVMSALRLTHGLKVHVCSLLSSAFIVSNRMAVEWQSESKVANVQNRRHLQDRMQKLQALHERVCLIVERDRTKPGETVQSFQRSCYYDGTLAALMRAGVRLMVSRGPEETATILSDLAQVEKRKGQEIRVPLEVRGHRLQAFQFFLMLPHVSYITGLNMCYNFPSITHVINSSVDELQEFACVTRARAEEIHRCLCYTSDTSLMTSSS